MTGLMVGAIIKRCLSNIKGIIPPITTPFDKNGNILYDKLEDNIAYLNTTGLNGVTMIGSNGEYALLSQCERNELVRSARKFLSKDKVVISGAGCETSKMTIEQIKQIADAGADALLLRAPHYYKTLMNYNTFMRFYTEVADNSSLPVIIYNIPPYTGVDLCARVISDLATHPNIIGIKESGGNMVKISTILKKTVNLDFTVFVGSASLLLPTYIMGGTNCICSLSGLLPVSTCNLYSLMNKSQFGEALKLQRAMIPLNDLITANSCSSAYKCGLDIAGQYGGPVRPPLEEVTESARNELKSHLVQFKAEFNVY